MKKLLKITLLLSVILIIILPLFARTAVNNSNHGRNWDMKWQDLNQLNMPLTNYGVFGQNVLTGSAGGYWPAGYPAENYMFGCGIWVGALVDTGYDADSNVLVDTLVSSSYNPNSGGYEFSPGDGSDAPLYNNPHNIVYKSTEDNGGYGWPLKRTDGSDSIVSMQDTWVTYSDNDPSQHYTEENLPLGLVVNQFGYTWVGPLKEDIIFMKFEIKNARTDGKDINNCYMGIITDLDIGNESGSSANDLLGFIDTMTIDGKLQFLNLGYQFQLDPEAGWAHTPGIIAFKYMESPIATKPIDLYHDSSVIIDSGQQIGMTTFNYFTLQTDPVNKEERYQELAGYDHLSFDPNNTEASYSPFPTWGEGTAGYPGQSEPAVNAGDKRFVMASGPFTLKNDSTANVVVAVMVARDVNELLDKALTAQTVYDAGFKGPVAPDQVEFSLKGLDEKVAIYWDDRVEKIADRYYEDASNTSSLLYNPAYKQYDVEGYNVYRSKTGAGGTWDLLAKYDLIDDITIELKDSVITWDVNIVNTDTTSDTIITRNVEYLYDTVGTNTGVPYSYIDTALTNGITYYYTITAYDYNFNAVGYNADSSVFWGADPLILESAGKTKAVTPRALPANYTLSNTDIILDTTFTAVIDSFDTDSNIILTASDTMIIPPIDTGALVIVADPIVDTLVDKISADNFTMEFNTITESSDNKDCPAYVFQIYADNDTIFTGQINIDTVSIVDESGNKKSIWIQKNKSYFAYNGMIFGIDSFSIDKSKWPTTDNTKLQAFIVSGNYDSTLVSPLYSSSDQYFYGSMWYRIIWHENTNADSLTAEVWDMQHNIEIPYGTDAKGGIWHFNPAASGDEYMTSSTVQMGMYIPYIQVWFNYAGRPGAMVWDDRPKEGDIWDIKIAYKDSTMEDFDMPPIGAKYTINLNKFQISANVDSMLLKVKVVPNPYVVRSEYSLDYRYQKIYFTHLPSKCEIKIFTLSGDLIKTIDHDVAFNVINSSGDTLVNYDYTQGSEAWDLLSDNDQILAPGIYLYNVSTPDGASLTGKFAIIK